MKLPLLSLRGRPASARAAARACPPASGSFRIGLFAVCAFCLASFAAAADGVVSQLSALKQRIEKAQDGQTIERYEPVNVVVPGDVLLCTVEYTNAGREPATNVVVTLPVPPEMTLTPNSATHPDIETMYSVDGGATFGALEQLSVKDAAGNVRPAQPQDVNSIRWTLRRELAPGQQGKVSYLATLR